jgi:hypothetical protein
MNTIMTIAHNANKIAAMGQASGEETANEPKVRLIYDVDNTEIHLLDGVRTNLEVVHPSHSTDVHMHAEEIIAAQKKIAEAVRKYEDKIYKRPPQDIA